MRIFFILLAFLVVSCVPKHTSPAPGQGGQERVAQPSARQAAAQPQMVPAGGVTRALMLNLSFHEPDVAEQRVVLRNGVWREEDTNKKCGDFCPLVWEVTSTAVGDLDGDKANNGVFLVASHGPTLHWLQHLLFAVTIKNGRCVLTRSLDVGDKNFEFKSLSIKDGKVRLVQRLSKKRTDTRLFVLRKGALVEVKGR